MSNNYCFPTKSRIFISGAIRLTKEYMQKEVFLFIAAIDCSLFEFKHNKKKLGLASRALNPRPKQ